jgi:hypothetical protein
MQQQLGHARIDTTTIYTKLAARERLASTPASSGSGHSTGRVGSPGFVHSRIWAVSSHAWTERARHVVQRPSVSMTHWASNEVALIAHGRACPRPRAAC